MSTELDDEVLGHLQTLPNRLIHAAATGIVDIRALTIREMRNRGLGIDGKWAQFDHAAMQWDRYEQDRREIQRELLDALKGIRIRVKVGRGLSSADAILIDDLIAKAETRQ